MLSDQGITAEALQEHSTPETAHLFEQLPEEFKVHTHDDIYTRFTDAEMNSVLVKLPTAELLAMRPQGAQWSQLRTGLNQDQITQRFRLYQAIENASVSKLYWRLTVTTRQVSAYELETLALKARIEELKKTVSDGQEDLEEQDQIAKSEIENLKLVILRTDAEQKATKAMCKRHETVITDLKVQLHLSTMMTDNVGIQQGTMNPH
jgi:hypothetical protein